MKRLQSQPTSKPRRRFRFGRYEEPIEFAPPPVPGQLRFDLDFEDQEEEKEDEQAPISRDIVPDQEH